MPNSSKEKQQDLQDRRQKFLLVDARNERIKDGLQEAYRTKVPGGMLEVFCVSNTAYEKYSAEGVVDMVNASGIPELRRFCYSITAEAQFLEAKHFLQSRLSSMLSSIQLWTTRCPDGSVVATEAAREALSSMLGRVGSAVR